MKQIFQIMFLFVGLSGCAVGPDYTPAEPKLPPQWQESSGEAPQVLLEAQSEALSSWWTLFEDHFLETLIAQALEANHDFRLAQSRVREARAAWGVTRGKLLPESKVQAGYERTRWSRNAEFPSDGQAFELYQAGFDSTWEIDIFGGHRREVESAMAGYEAEIEFLRDAQVSLVAEVAKHYVELVGLSERLKVVQKKIETSKKVVNFTRARFNSGWASKTDLIQAERDQLAIASTIPSLELSKQQSIHSLGLLLGSEPGKLIEQLPKEPKLPVAPQVIPTGLPTELLRRRPDVRRAERKVAEATARVGVAVSNLYPRFFLVGSAGHKSSDFDDLSYSSNRTWSIGPTIRWSLFQFGRARANIEVHNERQKQAIIRFEKTLAGALTDVENALISHTKDHERKESLENIFKTSVTMAELAQERSEQGLANSLPVLRAELTIHDSHNDLILAQQKTVMNAIALFKALGGGWDESSLVKR